jgi:hypothetical protein
LNCLPAGILGEVRGTLGAGVLAEVGAGELETLVAGTVDPGAEDGAEPGLEQPTAVSVAAVRSIAAIPPALPIRPA